MPSPIDPGFVSEVKSFVNDHKVMSVCTLGIVVLGYSIGNLASRAVSWIVEGLGIVKTTDTLGRRPF